MRTGRARAGVAWVVGLVFAAGCDFEPEQPREPAAADASVSAVTFASEFVDITQSAGLRFRHVTGGFGEKYLPETVGSGCAFLDFDGDARLDIFLVNSRHWTGHAPPGAPPATCKLYRGVGERRFQDVTERTGAGVSLYGMGCAAADYDADGDVDIFITAVDGNVLLRNEGGRFQDVTERAGVASGRWRDRQGAEHPEWSTAAAWADFDRDDDLDLLVTNYVRWTPETEIFTTMDGVHKAFTTPDRYTGLPCRLYRNRGDGGFEDASEHAGLLGLEGKALGLSLWDFDGDGDLDVAVANDTRPNFLLVNRGDCVFEELGLRLGVAYDEHGRARAGMGIDIADYANDAVPGIAIGNFSGEEMSLYRSRPEGGFVSFGARAGLAAATSRPLTFGVAFLDLDLDGRQDLAVVNGHIEPDIAAFEPHERYAQPAQILRGMPGGVFADASALAGAAFLTPRVGRGLAGGDIDEDGDIDLLVTENGGPAVLLENRPRGTPPPRSLRVRLAQPGRNRDAIGAHLILTSDGTTQRRVVRTGSSYLSQSELTQTVGLGTTARVDELRVIWPDGTESVHSATAAPGTLRITKP